MGRLGDGGRAKNACSGRGGWYGRDSEAILMGAQSWMPLAMSCAFVFVGGQARATTITGHMTADNLFSFYVSTDDAVAGTLVGSGNDWSASYTLSAELTPGVTNYIHVQATDQGSPQGFIGDFSLSDGGFQFANGTQLLLTTPAQWSLSFTGFGQNNESSITSVGMNGVGPWGGSPADQRVGRMAGLPREFKQQLLLRADLTGARTDDAGSCGSGCCRDAAAERVARKKMVGWGDGETKTFARSGAAGRIAEEMLQISVRRSRRRRPGFRSSCYHRRRTAGRCRRLSGDGRRQPHHRLRFGRGCR